MIKNKKIYKRRKRRSLLFILTLLSFSALVFLFLEVEEKKKEEQLQAEILEVKKEDITNKYEYIKKHIDEVFYEDEEVVNNIKSFIGEVEKKGLEDELLSKNIEGKYLEVVKIIDYSKTYLENEYNSIIENNIEYYNEEEKSEIEGLRNNYLKEVSENKYKTAKNSLEELKSIISEVDKISNKRRLDIVYDEEYNKGPYDREPTFINGLILVNKEFGLPENYAPGESYEARAAFEEMKAAALEEGIYIESFSTYRSYYTQYDLYYNYVYNYGEDSANTFSARPGFSEHQTGLAFDIGGLDRSLWAKEGFKHTDEAKWLAENCYKYGFILRYPEGKEWKTGYMYESWHFRYVGLEHSINFKDNNLTLEEYLNK